MRRPCPSQFTQAAFTQAAFHATMLSSDRWAQSEVARCGAIARERFMQSTFGPFYPSPLQESVNHAERFCEEVAAFDGQECHVSTSVDAIADRWICGRAGEIEVFVSDVTAAWRAKRLSAVSAANAVDRYLDDLHEGLAAFFGHAAPSCCARPSATRIVIDSAVDAPTRVAPFLEILAQSIRPAAGAPPRG